LFTLENVKNTTTSVGGEVNTSRVYYNISFGGEQKQKVSRAQEFRTDGSFFNETCPRNIHGWKIEKFPGNIWKKT
jgi:hypothetical protein